MPRVERTGWRDLRLSERHGFWGDDLPAIDLDFPLLEFCFGEPKALIEFKERHAQMPNLTGRTFQALTKWCDRHALPDDDGNPAVYAPLPFLVAFYCGDTFWFRVVPVNGAAKRYYRRAVNRLITEQEFVYSLYFMRGLVTDKERVIINRCNQILPIEEVIVGGRKFPSPIPERPRIVIDHTRINTKQPLLLSGRSPSGLFEDDAQ
jgi:hypothetical protein